MTASCRTSIAAESHRRRLKASNQSPSRRDEAMEMHNAKGRMHTQLPLIAAVAALVAMAGTAPNASTYARGDSSELRRDLAGAAYGSEGGQQQQDGFRFKSGVELINVTATVPDRSGRFYSRLRKEDFIVYEDNKQVEVTHFNAERTPVSLGIVVDTSGSMVGEKWSAAVNSIDRFFNMMSDELDEFFLYRFSANADQIGRASCRERV